MAVKTLGKYNQLTKEQLAAAKFEDLGVVVEGDFYLLKDLTIYSDDGNKHIQSLKQFLNAIKNKKYLDNKDATHIQDKITKDASGNIIFYSQKFNFEVSGSLISDKFSPEDDKSSIAPGLKRALKYEQAADGQYVYVQLKGLDAPELVPIKEIGYYVGSKFTTCKTLEDVKNNTDKNLFLSGKYNNATVSGVYLEAYKFTEIIKGADGKPLVESYLTTEKKKLDLVLKNGTIATEEKSLADYNVASYVKTGDKSSVAVKSYMVNTTEKGGSFVRLKLQDESKEIMVPIVSLRKVDKAGKPLEEGIKFKDLSKYIGQEIAVSMQDGKSVKTNALTPEQAYVSYDLTMHKQQTTDKADVLKDNTHLLLANGQFVKEKEAVKPISYEFVNDSDDDFDVYIVTVKSSSGEREVVVDKSLFLTRQKADIILNKEVVSVSEENSIKAKRCAYAQADAVQTTSKGARAEQCTLLADKKSRVKKKKAEREELLNSLLDEFLAKYKNGDYALDKYVDVENELKELAKSRPEQCRYVVQDFISQPDYGNKLNEYAFLKSTTLSWNGNKLVGGPQYNAMKAYTKDITTIAKVFLHVLVFSVGWGGILSAAISPFIVIGMLSAVAGAIPAMAIFRAIKNAWIERKNHAFKYKDKLAEQRKGVKKEIFEELKQIIADTADNENLTTAVKKDDKTAADQKLIEQCKAKFLNKFDELEARAATLSATDTMSEFRMVDGQGKVDDTNAHLFYQYHVEMEELEKRVKYLEKRKGKLTDEEKIELENSSQELERRKKNDVVVGPTVPEDSEYKKITELLAQVKGTILAKYFGETPTNNAEAELTDEQKAVLEALKDAEIEVNARKHNVKFSTKQKVAALGDKSLEEAISEIIAPIGKQAPEVFVVGGEPLKPTRKTPSPPKSPTEQQKRNEELKAMTNDQIEYIIKKVAKAMEKLREIGSGVGAYGKNDLSEAEESKAEQLKKVYEDNKYVLKYLVDHQDYVQYSALYKRYAATINTIGLTYNEFRTVVENASSRRL